MNAFNNTGCHQRLILEETLLRESVQSGALSPSEAALAMDDLHESMLDLQHIEASDTPVDQLPPTLFKLF